MNKYMKDFNGEKIFSLEYDKETLKDMVLEKQEEIERLNTDKEQLNSLVNSCQEEIRRLLSIIKEVRELTEMLYKNEANIFYKGTYKKQLEILDKVGSENNGS